MHSCIRRSPLLDALDILFLSIFLWARAPLVVFFSLFRRPLLLFILKRYYFSFHFNFFLFQCWPCIWSVYPFIVSRSPSLSLSHSNNLPISLSLLRTLSLSRLFHFPFCSRWQSISMGKRGDLQCISAYNFVIKDSLLQRNVTRLLKFNWKLTLFRSLRALIQDSNANGHYHNHQTSFILVSKCTGFTKIGHFNFAGHLRNAFSIAFSST